MPSFNVHRSTISETHSIDNKYYRFPKFQQSPPASALMELDISMDKGTVGEVKNTTPKSLRSEMEPPAHGRYKLQRGKPRRFRVPTKRATVDKPTFEVGYQYPDARKSLSRWAAYLLLSFVTPKFASAEMYSGAVHEAGDLIYLEICRLKLSNCVVVASLWYSRQIILGPLEEVHDIPAVLHHLFLLGACLARKDTSDPPLTVETWTQCLGRNAVDFCALVKAAMEYMYPDFYIGSPQWQEWLHCISQEAANHYPYDRLSQRAVQDLLGGLVDY